MKIVVKLLISHEDNVVLLLLLTLFQYVSNVFKPCSSAGAKQKLLEKEKEPIPLLVNEIEFYEPTDPEHNVQSNNHYNFKFKNTLPEFEGTAEVPEYDPISGLFSSYVRKKNLKCVPNMTFIRKNNLNVNSHPAD